MKHLLVSGALIAGLSLAARADDRADSAKVQRPAAKRHLITSQVAIEQARLGLQGLYALVEEGDGAFDTEHGQLLLDAASRAVKTACAHLGHLTPLMADDKDGRIHLTRLQTELARVQASLKALEEPVRTTTAATPAGSGGDATASKPATAKANDAAAGSLKASLKEAWKELDEAFSDFKKVADDYKVSTRLPAL